MRRPAPETSNGTTEGEGGTSYTTANLNLRQGPSTRDKVATVVKKGTKLTLTGKVSGGYAQVTYSGSTLWGSTAYLSSSQQSSSTDLPKITGQARGTTALMIRTSSSSKFTNLGDAPRERSSTSPASARTAWPRWSTRARSAG
ncbi:SH3 domain-containing protein [Tessaracoccus coleopterorum]|uniref:SH3 domain-containing protein n=1 Tax=Tessaracoccus coleopterorum TaxID=2714950 RepID=UPI002F917D4E